MKRVVLVSAVAIVALAACSKKPETPGGGPTATAAATSATTTTAAEPGATPTTSVSITPPMRRPGLWEQTIETGQMKQATKLCLDESVEKTMHWWGAQAGKSDCSQQKVSQKLGGGWEFSSTCNVGSGETITSHGVASGDFNSHYTVDIDSTTSGSSMHEANGPHKIKLEATWQGPCPADMKPGDMTLPGGMKINMVDAVKGGGPAAMHGRPTPAQIAQMRAQAEQMAATMKTSK